MLPVILLLRFSAAEHTTPSAGVGLSSSDPPSRLPPCWRLRVDPGAGVQSGPVDAARTQQGHW